MSKEEYYSKIKRFVYRKFDELEVTERNKRNDLYLHYKNNEYAEILIKKKSGEVYYNYNYELSDKFFMTINLEKVDFEILLGRWVEDTFQMKVNHTHECVLVIEHMMLKIPFK
jgi:hypothetical protein